MTDRRRWWRHRISQYGISTILLWTLIVALAAGWWVDRQRLKRRFSEAMQEVELARETVVRESTVENERLKSLLEQEARERELDRLVHEFDQQQLDDYKRRIREALAELKKLKAERAEQETSCPDDEPRP